jgi:O-antigen/teichoic acid export membrane protein
MLARLLARVRRLFDVEVRLLAANTAWMSVATAGKIVIGLVQVAVVTRFLGRGAYGQLALAMSVTGVISLVLAARVWEWVTKLFTDARTAGDREATAAVVKLGYLLSAGVNVLALAAVLACARFAAGTMFDLPQLEPLIMLFALTLLTSWLNDTSLAVLRVLGRFRFLALYGLATTGLRLGCLLVPLLLGHGLVGVIVGYVVAESVGCVVLGLITRSELRAELGGVPLARARLSVLAPRRKEILSMLGFSFGIDTLKSLGSQADVVILGLLRAPEAVADFKVAQTVVDVINRLAASLLMAAYPSLARLASRGDAEGMLRLIRRSSAVVTALIIPGCLAVTLLAPWLVELAAGPEFANAAVVLRVLVWSLVWVFTFWIVATCMSVGKSRWAFEFTALTLGAKLALVVPLTASHGVVGMAAGLSISSGVFVAVSLVYLARVTRFMRSPAFQPRGAAAAVSSKPVENGGGAA